MSSLWWGKGTHGHIQPGSRSPRFPLAPGRDRAVVCAGGIPVPKAAQPLGVLVKIGGGVEERGCTAVPSRETFIACARVLRGLGKASWGDGDGVT